MENQFLDHDPWFDPLKHVLAVKFGRSDRLPGEFTPEGSFIGGHFGFDALNARIPGTQIEATLARKLHSETG